MQDIRIVIIKFLVLFLFLTVLYSCQEESLDDVTVKMESSRSINLTSSVSVKKAFEKRKYSSKLYDKYDAKRQVYWQPIWADSIYKSESDTISYIYIPLRPKLLEIKTSRLISDVRLVDYAKFLILKQIGSQSEFYLATYIDEEDNAYLNSNATINTLNLNHFTGLLHLENIENGKKVFVKYENNKAVARYKGLSKKDKDNLTASSCNYTEVCYWYGDCGEGGVTGTSTSGINSCPYPSLSDCVGTQWTYSFSELKMECDGGGGGDPPPPPPPGGGGGGGGSPTDCAGVTGGYAFLDDCGECVGGTTGKLASLYYLDNDNDGWGNLDVTKACYSAEPGWTKNSGDYNDNCNNTANSYFQCANAILSSTTTLATLMTTYNLNVSVNLGNNRSIDPSINYKFEITRTGTSNWEILNSSTSTSYTRTARTSGKWDIRAKLTLNGDELVSNTVSVEEQYPSYNEIISNPVVASALQNYWQQTLGFASPSGRKEMGAWIYLDTNTGMYQIQNIPNSNLVQCGSGGASINPGSPTLYQPYTSPLGSSLEYVAVFHTHTPLTYCQPPELKIVGPSPADKNFANNSEVVGIVYDYIETRFQIINGVLEPVIDAGHAINSPAKLYHCGPIRRKTRTF